MIEKQAFSTSKQILITMEINNGNYKEITRKQLYIKDDISIAEANLKINL